MESKRKDATNEEIRFEEYTVLPAAMYRARLETISTEEMQFGPTVIFQWRVVEGEQAGEEVWGFATQKAFPKSKLTTWSKAHLNLSTFPDDFVLKLGALVGKEVFLSVGVEPRADGGGERNVVRAVDPIRPSTKSAKSAKRASADFNDMLSDEEIPDPGEPIRKGERKVED